LIPPFPETLPQQVPRTPFAPIRPSPPRLAREVTGRFFLQVHRFSEAAQNTMPATLMTNPPCAGFVVPQGLRLETCVVPPLPLAPTSSFKVGLTFSPGFGLCWVFPRCNPDPPPLNRKNIPPPYPLQISVHQGFAEPRLPPRSLPICIHPSRRRTPSQRRRPTSNS